MPRIRHDNDARYALRASFVDENGNVLQGDTIVITSAAGTIDSRITNADISNWNTAYGWGDHGTAGYLVATATDKANWNTAYSWGDHNAAGYLTSFTETDPTVPSHVKSITTTEKANWNTAYSWGNHAGNYLPLSGGTVSGNVNVSGFVQTDKVRVNSGQQLVLCAGEADNYDSGQTAERVYVNAEGGLEVNSSSDNWGSGWTARDTAIICSAGGTSSFPAQISVTGHGNSSQWNTAYGWGDHNAAGYLTAVPSTYTQKTVNENISAHWEWQDTWQVRFGNSADSRMWWDGTANRWYHRNYTHGSNMLWQAENAAGVNNNMLYLDPDDGGYIYYGGSVKLQTIGSGVDVFGNCNANGGQLWTNQQVRATGWWGTNGSTSWGGAAAELGVSSGTGYFTGYNRDSSSYIPVAVNGSGVTLNGQGNGITIASGNTLTLGVVNDAPAAWLPILANDSGQIKQDAACRVHGSGYIQANYFNTNHSQTTRNSDTIFYSSTDAYIRKNTAAGFRTSLSVYSKAEVDALPSGVTNISDNVTGNYGSVQTVATAGTSGGWHGYNAGGWGVFMFASNATGGIYDDVNNRWMFYSQDGSETAMYYAGSKKGYTYSSGYRVTGNLLATSDVYAYYSDERLKTKTGVIENPLAKINAIETFYYKHGEKALELGYEGEEQQVGVSAQSVQAVLPEVVGRAPIDDDGEGGSVSGEDYITVKYDRIVPLLIEGIKELTAELESVKLELQELKANV